MNHFIFRDKNNIPIDVSTDLKVCIQIGKRLRVARFNTNDSKTLSCVGFIGEINQINIYVDSSIPTVAYNFQEAYENCIVPCTIEEVDENRYNAAVKYLTQKPEENTADPVAESATDKKIKELSAACNAAIIKGVDVTLSDGEKHHIDLTDEDQINLLAISSSIAILPDKDDYPFHCAGELEKIYTKNDMLTIINTANNFKNYHLSYFNSLKNYVKNLTTFEEIMAVEYGCEIPEAYRTESFKVTYEEVKNYGF